MARAARTDYMRAYYERRSRSERTNRTTSKSITVPPDVLAEAEQAQSAPRSLTAAIFGDPPLSRSALGSRNR